MGLKELRKGFGLDPTKPKARQVVSIILQCGVLIGGPLLGLATINYYPFLIPVRTLCIGGIGSACLFFLLSFVTFRRSSDLFAFPLVLRLAFRFGWSICFTFLVWGLIGVANGFGTPLESIQVPVVAKRETLQRDPARRTYYLAVRPWRNSHTVAELPGQRATYDRLRVPVDDVGTPQKVLDEMPDTGQVDLIVGRGRLGLGWLKTIEPVSDSVNSRF
jgi:hypothetical protein